MPNTQSAGARCCFEVEFLVAKQRVEATCSPSDESPVPSRSRWVCPLTEQDDYSTILEQCKNVLVQDNRPVAITRNPVAGRQGVKRFNSESAGDSGLFGFWLVQPSENAVSGNNSPPEYEWLGIKLRSPLSPTTGLRDQSLNVWESTKSLCDGILTLVNSTCKFNIYVLPASEPMGLVTAKKLATLVLLFEQEMIIPLCPLTINTPSGRVAPLRTHSKIGNAILKGVEAARPADPLIAGIMDQYLPRIHDEGIQERLQLLWGKLNMDELAKSFHDANGQPTAFTLHLHSSWPGKKESVLAEFRYALWHPHEELDVSHHWIALCNCLMEAAAMPRTQFKQFIKSSDEIIEGFSGVDRSVRWKMLAGQLGLSEHWITSWEKVINEYGPGGQLSAEKIDKFPALG